VYNDERGAWERCESAGKDGFAGFREKNTNTRREALLLFF
jgi:hypothetical protein